MKKIIFALIAFLAMNSLSAQTSKTVIDYYKLLPDKFFNFPQTFDTKVKRHNYRIISKEDINPDDLKNDYFEIEANASAEANETYTCAIKLFKRKNNTYIIGFSQCVMSGSDPMEGTIKFLEYTSKGTWNDITKQIFTLPTDAELKKHLNDDLSSGYYFTLPKKGNTMLITNTQAEIKFEWNGEKFVQLN